MSRRQESQRVYLQHYIKEDQSQEASLNTKSAAIRLTSIVNAKEVCLLLRQKFGLPQLSSELYEKGSNPPPLVHRINAKLNQVRQSSSSKSLDSKNQNEKRKERRKKLLESQSKEDLLVIVATCSLPKGYVQYEHEDNNVTTSKGGSTSATGLNTNPTRNGDDNSVSTQSTHASPTRQHRTTTANAQNAYDKEPFNFIETLLPHEIPLQKQDEVLAYIDQFQDKVGVETFGETGHTQRTGKSPLIRWFFIPCHSSDIPKATVVIDGYCTDIDEDSDDSSIEIDHDEKSDMEDSHASKTSNWKHEIKDYHVSQDSTVNSKRLHKERHHFTVLSTFESVNGTENSSGYLWKQSMYDKQVWKRVHCVLTENQFWFVSRVKRIGKQYGSKIGKHGIIDLKGTLLLEPTFDSPLSGKPNTFQLTTKDGVVHVFQAGNRNAYVRWSQCLSDRIVLSQENSIFSITDAMISNEAQSRAAKCEQYFLEFLNTSLNKTPAGENDIALAYLSVKENFKLLLNLGRHIAEYKERCKRTECYFPTNTFTKNREDSKQSNNNSTRYLKHQSDWLVQCYTIFHTAESLFNDCLKVTNLFTKAATEDTSNILDIQNEIQQTFLDFHRHQKDHFHANDGNIDSSLRKFLLPGDLFDKLFAYLIRLEMNQ